MGVITVYLHSWKSCLDLDFKGRLSSFFFIIYFSDWTLKWFRIPSFFRSGSLAYTLEVAWSFFLDFNRRCFVWNYKVGVFSFFFIFSVIFFVFVLLFFFFFYFFCFWFFFNFCLLNSLRPYTSFDHFLLGTASVTLDFEIGRWSFI